MTRVKSLARSGAMSRQVMSDCGAPCHIKTGGPEPPMTALISAPEVLIRSLRKPGGNRRFQAGSEVLAEAAESWAAAVRAANAAAPAIKTSLRVVCISFHALAKAQRTQRFLAISALFARGWRYFFVAALPAPPAAAIGWLSIHT